MICPKCGENDDKVLDSRPTDDGFAVRRRRVCLVCGARFSTIEKIEGLKPMVVKKDGTKQLYDPEKIMRSLDVACQKRGVSQQVKEINFNTFSANLQNKGQQVRNDDNNIIRNDNNQLNRINIMDDPKPVRRQPAARSLVVTDETCKYLQAMHEYASEARGFFSDSPEYLAFHKALVDTEMKAKEIYGHRRDPVLYEKSPAFRPPVTT